ncbi:hypothetical protein PVAP13_5KG350507 [Panicum virgatum]|uniref:Uncharacterized protein n=1 Tax=Panicum virgatum TaxID=38727 RepID=A0A8T0SM21_PANVG|nr:hypothetical protein PVAP13_5KG350507 [Panicum virgatum]
MILVGKSICEKEKHCCSLSMLLTRNGVRLFLLILGSWTYEHYILLYENAIWVYCTNIHEWFSRRCGF